MEGKQFKTYVPGMKANRNVKYHVSEGAKTWASTYMRECTNTKKMPTGETLFWYNSGYRTRDGLLKAKMYLINRKANQRKDPVKRQQVQEYRTREDVKRRQ